MEFEHLRRDTDLGGRQGDGLIDFLVETVELGLAAAGQSVVGGRGCAEGGNERGVEVFVQL